MTLAVRTLGPLVFRSLHFAKNTLQRLGLLSLLRMIVDQPATMLMRRPLRLSHPCLANTIQMRWMSTSLRLNGDRRDAQRTRVTKSRTVLQRTLAMHPGAIITCLANVSQSPRTIVRLTNWSRQ